MAKHDRKQKYDNAPIGPTRERRRQAAGMMVTEKTPVAPGSASTITRVSFRDTCPLDKYLVQGKIDERQHKAGTWLANVFFRACLADQCLISGYRRWLIGGHRRAEPIHDARLTLWQAMLKSGLGEDRGDRCVPTPRGRTVLKVCGYGEPVASGGYLVVLAKGLNQLADYLKI